MCAKPSISSWSHSDEQGTVSLFNWQKIPLFSKMWQKNEQDTMTACSKQNKKWGRCTGERPLCTRPWQHRAEASPAEPWTQYSDPSLLSPEDSHVPTNRLWRNLEVESCHGGAGGEAYWRGGLMWWADVSFPCVQVWAPLGSANLFFPRDTDWEVSFLKLPFHLFAFPFLSF